MNYPWYTTVEPGTALSQGDLLKDCPTFTAQDRAENASDRIESAFIAQKADCLVLTQACDLEQEPRAPFVTLAPVYRVDVYRAQWEKGRSATGKKTDSEAWRNFLDQARKGHVNNLVLLKEHRVDGLSLLPYQIVDFQETYCLPRTFLEKWVTLNGQTRFRLLPPYREYVCHAFARHFMRIGLIDEIPLDFASAL